MNLVKKEIITIIGSRSFLGKNLNEEFLKSNYSVRFISSRLSQNYNQINTNINNELESINEGLIILTGWPISSDFQKL